MLPGGVFNPGRLKTKVYLGTRSFTTGIGGKQIPVYTAELKPTWVEWEWAHGPEAVASDAAAGEARATVRLRYRADLNRRGAVQLDGKWYEILSVEDIRQRHILMEMQVRRVEAA